MGKAMRQRIVQCGRFVLRPVYSWRGRIVSRKFRQELRFYDPAVRRALEWVLDAFELWAMRPGLDRLEAMANEADLIQKRLEDLAKEYNIDISKTVPNESNGEP